MPATRNQTGFDHAHNRAVILVFLAAVILAFFSLELVRWYHLKHIQALGFLPWGDDGYYVRDVPGRSLILTTTHSQALIAVSTITAGSAAAMLFSIAAALDMHLPFRAVSRYTLLAFLLLPVAVLAITVSVRDPDRLTIDIRRDFMAVTPGNVAVRLSSVREFDHYWVNAGRLSHEELGVVTGSEDQVDLLPVSSSLQHRSYWEALYLTNALQEFVSSDGKEFPAS
jgi:hypothetical protein